MSRPVITFADPIPRLLTYLAAHTGDVPVEASVPSPRPPRLVTIRRAGGVESGPLDRPRIDAVIWDADEAAAMQLGSVVRAWLLAAPGLVDGVTAASTFLGPTTIPDPESNQPRVLLTVELVLKGESTA